MEYKDLLKITLLKITISILAICVFPWFGYFLCVHREVNVLFTLEISRKYIFQDDCTSTHNVRNKWLYGAHHKKKKQWFYVCCLCSSNYHRELEKGFINNKECKNAIKANAEMSHFLKIVLIYIQWFLLL